jgi:hypothetical protein
MEPERTVAGSEVKYICPPPPERERERVRGQQSGPQQCYGWRAACSLQLQINFALLPKKKIVDFCNTRYGTRVFRKEMMNFPAIKLHFDDQKIFYLTFYLKSQKPVKIVIRHLPYRIPVEDVSDRLIGLGFNVISVKLATTNRRSSEEGTTTTKFP